MAVCIRLQIERKKFESSAGLCKITCLMMDKFDSEEKVINQYPSQTKKVLWQNGFMHRSEIPDIVVQFHGAPHLVK
jgi:hypothetical protein